MSDRASTCVANPLAAAFYADQAIQRDVEVVENVQLARDTYRLRLEYPELADRIQPGQFVMIRLAEGNDPLLGRPLALYDTYLNDQGRPQGIDVVYLVVGRMTSRLAAIRTGDRLSVTGPLGNGFSPQPAHHLIMVAGGIGQTPFLALGREFLGGRQYGNPARASARADRVTLCYGVRTADLLAGADDFRTTGIDLQIASDDGSVGQRGLATDLLQDVIRQSDKDAKRRIVCCGPEPMMEAVAEIAKQYSIQCEVSLETPMACGIGICFSCVVKVLQPGGGWDYKRTCVDGPVFDAEKICW